MKLSGNLSMNNRFFNIYRESFIYEPKVED